MPTRPVHVPRGAADALEQKVARLLKGHDVLWPNVTGDRTLWPGRTPDLEAGRAVAAAERAHAPAKDLTGVLNRTAGLTRWFSVALCLMPWSSNVGPEIGSPLVFGECRQRRARNQRWAEEPVSGGTSRGRFRLRLVGTTLCVASNICDTVTTLI